MNKQVLSILCLIVLLATPLFGEVFAQSESAATSTSELTAPTSTTAVESASNTSWYRSERIFGNIAVGDFVVGPGRTEIVVNPGETVVQEISVTNRITEDRQFKLEVEDVRGTSDASSAVNLTAGERGPYSIRDYISFPDDSFVLELGERAHIPVTISVPPDAEPGGYYGSVLVSTVRVADGDDGGSTTRSPIIARVGSLIFLTVRGEAVTEGSVTDLSLIDDKLWYEKGPIELGVLYENTGSVHLNPYGEISVTNMFGEQVGFVELEPWFVLPQSLRLREISWDREFLLGRYTATALINRGYDDIVDEVTVSFWVLPWKIIGGVFLVLFIVIFTLRAFLRTFEFKRKSG